MWRLWPLCQCNVPLFVPSRTLVLFLCGESPENTWPPSFEFKTRNSTWFVVSQRKPVDLLSSWPVNKKNRSAEPLRKWNGEVSHKRQWWFKVITSWGLLWNQTENGYMNNNYISCVWCHHGSISILTYQGVTLKRWLGPHHCSDTVVNTSSQQFSDLVPGKSFMFQSSWKAK